MATSDPIQAALEAEVLGLELKFSAKGVRREDGKTAAEVEAEQLTDQETAHGTQ